MSINDLLRTEAEHAEQHPDTPTTPGTIITRPGGAARVYSLRLTGDQVADLEAAAERAGVPASALARTWISERLAADDGTTDLHAIAQTLETFSKRLAAL